MQRTSTKTKLNLMIKMKLVIIAVTLIWVSIYEVSSVRPGDVRCYSCGYEIFNGTKRAMPDETIPFCDDFATAGDYVVDAGEVGITYFSSHMIIFKSRF